MKTGRKSRPLQFLDNDWRPSPGEVLVIPSTGDAYLIKDVLSRGPNKYFGKPCLFIDANGYQYSYSHPTSGICWGFLVTGKGRLVTTRSAIEGLVMSMEEWHKYRKANPCHNVSRTEPEPRTNSRGRDGDEEG